jgi:hypothetical protein
MARKHVLLLKLRRNNNRLESLSAATYDRRKKKLDTPQSSISILQASVAGFTHQTNPQSPQPAPEVVQLVYSSVAPVSHLTLHPPLLR